MLVELTSQAQERGAEILACLEASGFGEEQSPLTSDASSTGSGLCEALRAVMSSDGSARWICCDLNGESYRSFEWGVARTRLGAALEAMQVIDHPADCTGDLGAATGGSLLNHVIYALGRPRPPADEAILWTSSDEGARATLRVKGA